MPWSKPSILEPTRADEAVHHLNRYFQPSSNEDSGVVFSGSRFDNLGGGGDGPTVANTITNDDILALSMLGVPVMGGAALTLLEGETAVEISRQLKKIGSDLSITNSQGREALLSADMDGLWKTIRKIDSFGPVRTSKLLARKRPHLVPIYDSVVKQEFGARHSGDQWTEFVRFFEDRQFTSHLEELRDRSEAPRSLSLLRVLDIVVWMEGR